MANYSGAYLAEIFDQYPAAEARCPHEGRGHELQGQPGQGVAVVGIDLAE